MERGKFIVIEGGEGAGKGMCIEYLKERLEKRKNIFFTREPGGTLISEQIRHILMDSFNKEMTPLTEIFLFCGARAQHVEQLIKPIIIEKGGNVICDRFDYSTIAYQIFGRARFDLEDDFYRLNLIAKAGIEPNVVIYLDVDPEVGLSRRGKSKEGCHTRFDKEILEFHIRAREGYVRQYTGSVNKSNALWYRIDTTSMNKKAVKEEVLSLVIKNLNI